MCWLVIFIFAMPVPVIGQDWSQFSVFTEIICNHRAKVNPEWITKNSNQPKKTQNTTKSMRYGCFSLNLWRAESWIYFNPTSIFIASISTPQKEQLREPIPYGHALGHTSGHGIPVQILKYNQTGWFYWSSNKPAGPSTMHYFLLLHLLPLHIDQSRKHLPSSSC